MAPIMIEEIEDERSLPKTLELTPVEATFRRLLLDVASYIDENPVPIDAENHVQLPKELEDQPLVLRFTGGWVRDKLLGVGSHDIDVGINKMTGYQFGLRLKEYLEIPGNPEKYGLEGVATNEKQDQKAGVSDKSKTVGGLHKIEANPEKSKHLETVATRVFGLDVDLVNLRKETYADDSRNPQMEFGSPEEDALRRDANVNAMFYNINKEEVEDFTGRGYQDLQDKILRTPLDPFETFKDDPLRVLRLIRFSSRLGFEIDDSAKSQMQRPEIQDALRRKISRERVGVELEKALRGPDPRKALQLVFELHLYETVFSDPSVEGSQHYKPETESWQVVLDALQETVTNENDLATILMTDDEEYYLAWVMAAMTPYSNAPQPEAPEPGRKRPPPIAATVAKEGIKAPNKVSDIILAALLNFGQISELVYEVSERKRDSKKRGPEKSDTGRDVLGMALRKWGSSWRSQIAYAWLAQVSDAASLGESSVRDNTARYTLFVQELRDLSLLDVCSLKPILDGKTLAKALNVAPGPWMKDALDVVMAYQLRNPDTATPEAAIADVQRSQQEKEKQKENGGELTSSLVHHFLKLTIRPLFAKTQPSSVTDSGRKNTKTVLPPKLTMNSLDETEKHPWKAQKESYALELFSYCVKALNEDSVKTAWPMVIPPVLTLLDDYEARYKQLGAQLAKNLLSITPSDLLARTGLGSVFEDALMPCLTYIPKITPEEESIPLLNEVYPALLTLARVRFPTNPPSPSSSTTKSSPTDTSADRMKFIDTIIRKGVLYGYTHCNTHPRIVSTLLTHLVGLLNEEGIESVKHLKFILPMLNETLSHPLASASSSESREVFMAATKALQSVILNGWPRMVVHRGEVLKGLAVCWIKLETTEAGSEDDNLRGEMRKAVAMLKTAVGDEVDFEAECCTLVEADERAKGLFK